MAQHLFIVSRQSLDLYSFLSKEFSSEPDVTVIIDRRQGERRTGERPATGPSDRRLNERRLKPGLGRQLSTLGYAFVRLP